MLFQGSILPFLFDFGGFQRCWEARKASICGKFYIKLLSESCLDVSLNTQTAIHFSNQFNSKCNFNLKYDFLDFFEIFSILIWKCWLMRKKDDWPSICILKKENQHQSVALNQHNKIVLLLLYPRGESPHHHHHEFCNEENGLSTQGDALPLFSFFYCLLFSLELVTWAKKLHTSVEVTSYA